MAVPRLMNISTMSLSDCIIWVSWRAWLSWLQVSGVFRRKAWPAPLFCSNWSRPVIFPAEQRLKTAAGNKDKTPAEAVPVQQQSPLCFKRDWVPSLCEKIRFQTLKQSHCSACMKLGFVYFTARLPRSCKSVICISVILMFCEYRWGRI